MKYEIYRRRGTRNEEVNSFKTGTGMVKGVDAPPPLLSRCQSSPIFEEHVPHSRALNHISLLTKAQ
jgi:hypothetical protein